MSRYYPGRAAPVRASCHRDPQGPRRDRADLPAHRRGVRHLGRAPARSHRAPGALAGLAAAGRLVAAVGTARGLRLGFAAYPAALMGTAFAPALGWLAAAMAVM